MTTVSKFTAQSGQYIKHHSPEILAVVGVGTVITAGVLAARATLKLEGLVSDLETARVEIRETDFDDEKQRAKELFKAQAKFVGGLVKLYGIPVGLGAAGIGAMLGAQGVLKKRNFALVGAYSSLEAAYGEYRKRVVEAVGPEREADIRLNLRAQQADEDLEGSSDTKSAEELDADEKRKQFLGASQYAAIFDEHTSPFWSPNPDISSATLRSQQNYANERLVSRGYIFLNEIFDALGMEKTKAGQFVGWVVDPDADGENFVDFGLDNMENIRRGAAIFDEDGHFVLDFNVQGNIVDKLFGKGA